MSKLVVIDADVLGRHRTGDETYVENLLRRLPALAGDEFTFAALTRRPDLVPEGVEAVEVPARFQELRMLLGVPRALRRLRPALAHFQHSAASPLAGPDGRDGARPLVRADGDRDGPPRPRHLQGRRAVVGPPRAAGDRRLRADEARPDRALPRAGGADHRDAARDRPRVRAPRTTDGAHDYLLFVGAIQERKNPLAALEAAEAVGLPLVVAGPEREPALARELERRGADLRGYVEKDELAALYRGAAVLVLPSRYEGFGLPVLEAMACGTPVVANPDPALKEVAGDAALYAEPGDLAEAIRRAIAERGRLVAAGFARAAGFTWDETARLTLEAYRKALA